MCKISTVSEKKVVLGGKLQNLTVDLMPIRKTCKKFVAFLTNLHSWQEFYMTAGHGGRDKF